MQLKLFKIIGVMKSGYRIDPPPPGAELNLENRFDIARLPRLIALISTILYIYFDIILLQSN